MPPIFFKNILVEIKSSLGRFISILSIVAIGVAFFAGIKASSPVMKNSADHYFDQYNLQDIQIFSTLGLSEDDLQKIQNTEGVKEAQGIFTIDTLTKKDKSQLVVQVFSWTKDQNINRVRLVDGRMPQKENECLIEASSATSQLFGNFQIGDTITLTSGTDTPLSDTLENTEFTVVGTCYTPTYLSYQKGASSIGSGSIDTFIFIPYSNIKVDYYTEIDVTVEGALEKNTYQDGYFEIIKPVKKRIEDLADPALKQKIKELQDELDKAKQEYIDKLADGQKQLDDAAAQIQDGEAQIQSSQAQLDNAKEQLDSGWNEYYSNSDLVHSSLDTVNNALAQIEEGERHLSELVDAKSQLESGLSSIETIESLIKVLQQITSLGNDINDKTVEELRSEVERLNQMLESEQLSPEQKEELTGLIQNTQTALDNLQSLLTNVEQNQDQIYETVSNLIQTSTDEIVAMLEQIEIDEEQYPEIAKRKKEIEEQIEQVNQDIQDYIATHPDHSQEIQELEQTISNLQAEIDTLQKDLENDELTEEERASLNALIQADILALNEAIAHLEELKELQKVFDQGYNELITTKTTLEENLATVNSTLDQINEGIAQKETLQNTLKQLEDASKQLEDGYQTLVNSQAQYEDGLAQLQSGIETLESSKKQYQDAVTEFEKQKEDGRKQLDDAQKEIDDLEGQWYVLDRDSHYSYRDYEACANRMDGIAKVFPVFFFLVAALVCMTTMTRMVDEQRQEIGTLKALGYSKGQIAAKYLLYALAAGVIGSIIGCAVGMVVFPYVIFTAWNMLYNLEQIYFSFPIDLILTASLSVIGITLLATAGSIYASLMDVPSQLMRPKAAKAGKKILLERIPPLWSSLSFLHKVTARNIFRYKKRFFMTIVGIAGCSALLVAGFGINDSISDIARAQYEDIYHYNALVTMEKENKETENTLSKLDGVTGVFKEKHLSATIEHNHKDMSFTVHVIDDPKTFETFTTLSDAKTKKEVHLDDQTIIISQKAATQLEKKVGDTITFKDADEREITAKIGAIYENYVGHHMYVTESLYNTWLTAAKTTTSYQIRTNDQTSDYENELGNEIMDLEDVNGVTFYSSLQKNFTDLISRISIIVVVLVISAALLAFVVLYNLSNVNISERVREIATIKVLGFTPKEVDAYVNRESIILTMIGAVIGLVIGIYLHHLIMNLAEMDEVMFGRTILPTSYLLSFAMTMGFSFIINGIMHGKLKKIKMVESLKAVE